MNLPIDPTQTALAFGIATIAAAVQGSLGFGAALLAAPLLRHIHPAFVPGPIMASNLALTVLVARREWSSVDFAGLGYVVGGRLAGTALAAGLLVSVSQRVFDGLFGVLVLVAVALSLVRGGFRQNPANLTVAGMASGVMGTLSSIGGPPVALVYQRESPPRFRATLAVHLLVGASVSVAALWLVGRFGQLEVALTVVLLPASVAGYALSRYGIGWIATAHLRIAVLALSAVAALGVLWRAVVAGAGF